MKQFFITMLGVFAGLVAFFVVLPVVAMLFLIAAASSAQPSVPTNTVLELDLRQGLTDQPLQSPLAMFGGSGLAVTQVVDTLAQAGDDSAVKAVLIRAPEGGITPAAADEIRQALQRFRAKGKTVIAHSQGFYPMGSVISSYSVVAGADELWLSDTASFQATGLSSEMMFLGRAFEKYGLEADFEQRYEYKNAVNELTQSDYTPAHREAQLSWMGSIYETALGHIASDRKIDAAQLKTLIEAGPYSATEALSLKLVDRLGEAEQAQDAAKTVAGKDAEIVTFGTYASMKGSRNGSGKSAIAIVNAEGAIMTGRGSSDPFASGNMIRSDDTAKALYEAIKDDAVKAIVMRVSSPGGSPEASEQILAALRAAKAAGKPVVVSMGGYAASGGYWISSEADWIVAQPSTLTGSIGVYGGKLVLGDALGRFGLDMRSLSVGGEFADAYASGEGFDAADRAKVAASMDRIYAGFLERVSKGRKLPVERVHEIARGRVWTGAQGKDLGLVDQLGGLEEAVIKARQLANIPSSESVRFKRYPAPQSPWEAIASTFGASGQAARALIALGQIMGDPAAQGVVQHVETQRLRERGATVLADQPTF